MRMHYTCSRMVRHGFLPDPCPINPTPIAESDMFSWWIPKSSNPVLISKPTSWRLSKTSLPPDADKVKPSLPVVALGGTFDHLHAGHKILLSMAAWISQKKLIVGVTGSALSSGAVH